MDSTKKTLIIIQVILWFVYFWPGGLLYNRIEPMVLGLPFIFFWTWVLIPIIALINFIIYAYYSAKRDDVQWDGK